MLIPHVRPAVLLSDLLGSTKRSVLSRYFRQNYYWTGSGSSAIYLAIKASSAKKIATPAFTCSIVPDAVRKAGAKVQFYDCGIVATLTDVRKALSRNPDLIILSYNFGLVPDNLNKILAECRKRKVAVLEDCAHAFGFGQNADFTIYSCGIAKSLSYYGGFLLSRRRIEVAKLKEIDRKKELMFTAKALANQFVFNPRLYSFVNNIIYQQIEKYPKAKLFSISSFAKKVVLRQINRFGDIQKVRNQNFNLAKNLKSVVKTKQKSNLYLVIQLKNRNKIIQQLRKKDIEILPAKSFFNLAGKKYPKASKAEKEHLVFSLYRPKEEIRRFVNAYKAIKN